MSAGNHTGHQVRGRYRDGEQIRRAVARLRRDEFLILDCGAADDCYAQVESTLQGVYDVEFRDGCATEHYRTRTQSAAKAAGVSRSTTSPRTRSGRPLRARASTERHGRLPPGLLRRRWSTPSGRPPTNHL